MLPVQTKRKFVTPFVFVVNQQRYQTLSDQKAQKPTLGSLEIEETDKFIEGKYDRENIINCSKTKDLHRLSLSSIVNKDANNYALKNFNEVSTNSAPSNDGEDELMHKSVCETGEAEKCVQHKFNPTSSFDLVNNSETANVHDEAAAEEGFDESREEALLSESQEEIRDQCRLEKFSPILLQSQKNDYTQLNADLNIKKILFSGCEAEPWTQRNPRKFSTPFCHSEMSVPQKYPELCSSSINPTLQQREAPMKLFKLMFCKKTNKKQKSWNGGFLIIKGPIWTILDEEGRIVSRFTQHHKVKIDLKPGDPVSFKNWQGEIEDEISKYDYETGRCFYTKNTSHTFAETICTTSKKVKTALHCLNRDDQEVVANKVSNVIPENRFVINSSDVESEGHHPVYIDLFLYHQLL